MPTDLAIALAALDACRGAVRACAESARATDDEVLKIALVQTALKVHVVAEELTSLVRRAERESRGQEPSPEAAP